MGTNVDTLCEWQEEKGWSTSLREAFWTVKEIGLEELQLLRETVSEMKC